MTLGACGSELSTTVSGPGGRWIPLSPTRRHARSGRCARGKVERGHDSLPAVPWLHLYCMVIIMLPPEGVLWGWKEFLGCSFLQPLLFFFLRSIFFFGRDGGGNGSVMLPSG
jgi:hypothetical protein